jgi:hypothetical protein
MFSISIHFLREHRASLAPLERMQNSIIFAAAIVFFVLIVTVRPQPTLLLIFIVMRYIDVPTVLVPGRGRVAGNIYNRRPKPCNHPQYARYRSDRDDRGEDYSP